jgi:hypothetical protein
MEMFRELAIFGVRPGPRPRRPVGVQLKVVVQLEVVGQLEVVDSKT